MVGKKITKKGETKKKQAPSQEQSIPIWLWGSAAFSRTVTLNSDARLLASLKTRERKEAWKFDRRVSVLERTGNGAGSWD